MSNQRTLGVTTQLRDLGLWAYYYGTLPYRLWARHRDCEQRQAPVMILFYHRICDEHPNAWTISHQEFQFQIDWLRDHTELVSLDEAQRRMREGNPRPCVSITFDDGYGDNCHWGLPYLIKHRVPCTYFVSVEHVMQGIPFPHDVAAGCALRPNTPDEIRSLSDAGIEIGVHGMQHIDLGQVHDKVALHRELVVSREILTELLGRCPRYFAFPYGLPHNITAAAFQLAQEQGYRGVCSAYGAYNLPGADPFHLQRIHADPERSRFLNWMTVDPRKRNLRPPLSVDQAADWPVSEVGVPV